MADDEKRTNPFPLLRNLLCFQCFQIVSSKVFGTTWNRME